MALGSALRRGGSAPRPATRCGEASSSPGAAARRRWPTRRGPSSTRRRPAAPHGAERAESLTPSERRVAELAAEGNTNRDIAQTLYVTPKTVEVHLTSVYRKLGIGSRAALSEGLASPPA